MRYLLIATLLFTTAPVFAEEFTSEAAQAAKAAYEADLQAAREKYAAALNEAAKVAVEASELDEVVRIKGAKEELEGGVANDPIVAARNRMQNTIWTFDRPGDKKRLHFHQGGKVIIKPGDGSGVWEMLEPRVGAMKFSRDMFVFQFDESMNEFQVHAYNRVQTKFSVSKKVGTIKLD